MCPESISEYIKNEKIERCLFGINGCPIPVLVEHPDGQEFPIVKAYRITGRTAAIKILVDCEGEQKAQEDKVSNLKDSIKNLESEIQDLKDAKSDTEEELEKWTDAFGDDPETTKTLWNEIEEAVRFFSQIAEINLVANDARNISKLQKEYEDKAQLLSEADEIVAELREEVAELKVDNKSLAWQIKELTNEI
jgi:septal ring factor EnvC (AmiA/AmiB activator)